ncbi:MAG TPA: 3-phosphoglycerate dehydrogenase [Flavobacteriaceae bacterium]|nr:3-phosphoglycerate dehydrogenase [Flavobacteriaceae bacterium]
MKVHANDGISQSGIQALEAAGIAISTTKVAQEQLVDFINRESVEVLLVRSATTARKELIDACPGLKIIGRGGVGMDNIDVDYARSKGLHVINTPAASSASVAELVFAHLYGGVRFLHQSNRAMAHEGDTNFGSLKKAYAKGRELRGKTMGIVGFGRIGKAVAEIALGAGMRVIYFDQYVPSATITLKFYDNQEVKFDLNAATFETILAESDFITLHVPAQKDYVISAKELTQMKAGAGLINAARGGVVDEVALLEALESRHISFAALDVFENEPTPAIQVLMNEYCSLTPHIGAATNEAQDRIGEELAAQIIGLTS